MQNHDLKVSEELTVLHDVLMRVLAFFLYVCGWLYIILLCVCIG